VTGSTVLSVVKGFVKKKIEIAILPSVVFGIPNANGGVHGVVFKTIFFSDINS
jgi:hypothetical protein